jgi:hypothetical protein
MLPMDVATNLADPLHSGLAEDIYQVTRMAGLKSATPLYIYNGEQEFWIPAEGARNPLATMRSTTSGDNGRSSKLRTIRRRRTTSWNSIGYPP